MLREDEITAAKKLGRLKLNVKSSSFSMPVLWCRTAYSTHEKWDISNHRHSSYELHLVLEGTCKFLIDSTEVSLYADDFLIINPQQMHKLLYASADLAKFVMAFELTINTSDIDGQFIKKAFASCQSTTIYHSQQDLRRYVDQMMIKVREDEPGCISDISAYLQLLCLSCARSILPKDEDLDPYSPQLRTNMYVESARNYIKDNACNGIVSSDVSQHINISEKQLNRILISNLNTTVAKLIEEEKMNRLRQLLLSEDTLETVAEKVGFSNAYNMSRFFKRLEGMAPGKYRKAFYK